MQYLVLPHAHVQAANFCNTNYLIGGPQLLSAYGLGQSVCFRLGGGARVTGLLIVHHNIQPLGETFHGVFQPQQRRGASYTYESSHGSDYSNHNKRVLSLQPTATAHMDVSIVWEVEDLDDIIGATNLLDIAKFAGGLVTRHEPITVADDVYEALERIRTGWLVADRRDLLAEHGSNQLEEMIAALGTKDPDNPWLSATCLGYAAVTPFATRSGAREGYEHAFAEPLVGMVQYVSLRKFLSDEAGEANVLWRPGWMGERSDVFLLQGHNV